MSLCQPVHHVLWAYICNFFTFFKYISSIIHVFNTFILIFEISSATFSPLKKKLQRLGSRVVRMVSGTDVPDAPSGFRAYSRETAMKLNVVSRYTYTLETIIQAGNKNIALASVPVRTNPQLRKSRLSQLNWMMKPAVPRHSG